MNAAAGLVEVRVPDMGNFKDVAIIDVLVKPGEKIELESPLVTLETEKATMDVPSTVEGVVEKIHISKGGTVSPGDLIVTVRTEAAGAGDQADAGASADGGASAGAGAGASRQPGTGAAGSGAGGAAGQPGAGASQAAATAGAGAAGQAAVGAGGGAAPLGRAAAGAGGTGASGGAATASQTAAAGAGAATARSGGAGAGAATTGSGGAGVSGEASGSMGASGAAGSGATSGAQGGAQGVSGSAQAASSGVAGKAGGAASGSAPGAGASANRQAAAGGSGTAASAGGPSGQSHNGSGPSRISGGSLDLPPINEPGFSRAHAGPSVRRFARELGVDLTQVAGGGFKGRVTHDDVKAFVKKFLAAGQNGNGAGSPAVAPGAKATGTVVGPNVARGGGTGLPAVPVIDFKEFGEIEIKPLSRIQKISGPRLHASWVNIPHVTQFDEADITDLEDARAQLKQKALQAGIKLTPLAFIVRACVKALQQFPQFNSSLDPSGSTLILKKYIHVGFAADTPNGLVVPVVRDANRKDVYEIARQLGELSEKARAGKLSAAEMQGGCFTISSLGGIGGTAFTPIINAPEVAILGVSRSAMKPVFRDGTFVPRLILPLSLSYDHRVIDGASAARFTTFLAQTLADPRGLTEAVP